MITCLGSLISVLLIVTSLYGFYGLAIGYIDNLNLGKILISYFFIFAITFLYVFYRAKLYMIEILVSIIFFLTYVVFSSKYAGNAFQFLKSQIVQMYNFGFDFYQLLNIIMALTWILLMILPIVHFFYLKKNKIAPYN